MSNINIDDLLQNCANEKIHLIGEIQDFACLIAINKDFKVKVISENFKLFEKSISLNSNLKDYISDEEFSQIQDFIHNDSLNSDYSIFLGKDKKRFFCFKSNDLVVMEHEVEIDESNSVKKEALINSLTGFSINKDKESGIKELAQSLAENIKRLIGYDRVMVYKFHPDDHGEVIAESKERNLEPFINLHYPESDIPKQARELFIRNQIRLISNIDGKRIKLRSSEDTEFVDLSDSISRHASIVHIEYLKNMKVGASLAISIIVEGKLWGLIACHHYSPKFISFANRSFLKLVGFSFAIEVSKFLEKQLTERIKKINMINVSFINELGKIKDDFKSNFLDEIVKPQVSNLLSIQQACGMYIEVGNNSASIGKVPSKDVIRFVQKEISKNKLNPFFYTNSLSSVDKKFESIAKDCSGVLGAGIVSGTTKCFVVWFRPETLEEIKWAGKDDKHIVYDGEHARLSPRGSFDEIVRLQKNTSLFFNEQDKEVAFEFLWFLSKVLLAQLRSAENNLKNLEREASEKDKFISNLSHELRTPLNNILGWLQLYDDQLHSTDELSELARVIKNNSNQQLKLVNDLLDASKISAGKIKLDLKTLDIREGIQNIYKYFMPSFKNKSIDCFLSLSSDNLTCAVDETRFEQILRNVIQNSLKFTPKHGKIFISAKKESSDAIIEIKDTGIGIEKKELGLVLKQFYQSDDGRSRMNKGMGLGLALVKNIVELHGGNIHIKSEGLNEGTTVTIKMPLNAVNSSDTQKYLKEIENNTKIKSLLGRNILLVEDTIESARFVRMFLEKEGAKVHWSSNAMDALEALRNNKNFDTIISDIGLPEMDGLEFVENAREVSEYDKKLFLALSAYGSGSEIKRSIAAGFDKHLVKPVDLQELLESIRDKN